MILRLLVAQLLIVFSILQIACEPKTYMQEEEMLDVQTSSIAETPNYVEKSNDTSTSSDTHNEPNQKYAGHKAIEGWKYIELEMQKEEEKRTGIRVETVIKDDWYFDNSLQTNVIYTDHQEYVFSVDFLVGDEIKYFAPVEEIEECKIGSWTVWKNFRVAPPKEEKDFWLYGYGLLVEDDILVVFTFTGYDGEIQEEILNQEFIIENTIIEVTRR